MKNKKMEKSAKWPQDAKAEKRLRSLIELEELGELELFPFPFMLPRFLVTYMNSQARSAIRSSTIVSITNRSEKTNRVAVYFYYGFSDDAAPVGQAFFTIPPDYTIDIASRDVPNSITTTNAVSSPELTFHEGRAVVFSQHAQIGVSSRVVYTEGDKDSKLLAISDSNVVNYYKGNQGD
jgi:hypothetical protein